MNIDEIKATVAEARELLAAGFDGPGADSVRCLVGDIDAILAERERVRNIADKGNECGMHRMSCGCSITACADILAILDEKETTDARGGGNFGKG